MTTELNDAILNEYLDDVLSPAKRAALEARLAQDPDAAARLGELRVLFAELEALPDVPLTRNLAPAVVAATMHRPQPATPQVLRLVFVAQALAVLLAFVLAGPTLSSGLQAVPIPQLDIDLVAIISAVATSATTHISNQWAALADLDVVTLITGAATSITTATGTAWAALAGQAQHLITATLPGSQQQLLNNVSSILVLGLCVASASLLWVLSNNFLLRPIYRSHHLN